MFPALTVKFPERKDDQGNPKPAPKWHPYSLIPQVSEFGEDAEQYHMRMLCWEVAQGNVVHYRLLYEGTLESEVIELYGFFLAKLYPID